MQNNLKPCISLGFYFLEINTLSPPKILILLYRMNLQEEMRLNCNTRKMVKYEKNSKGCSSNEFNLKELKLGRVDHGFIEALKSHMIYFTDVWISFPEILL